MVHAFTHRVVTNWSVLGLLVWLALISASCLPAWADTVAVPFNATISGSYASYSFIPENGGTDVQDGGDSTGVASQIGRVIWSSFQFSWRNPPFTTGGGIGLQGESGHLVFSGYGSDGGSFVLSMPDADGYAYLTGTLVNTGFYSREGAHDKWTPGGHVTVKGIFNMNTGVHTITLSGYILKKTGP